jgi:hypothetical protein
VLDLDADRANLELRVDGPEFTRRARIVVEKAGAIREIGAFRQPTGEHRIEMLHVLAGSSRFLTDAVIKIDHIALLQWNIETKSGKQTCIKAAQGSEVKNHAPLHSAEPRGRQHPKPSMTHSAAIALPGVEYNDFLFAPIGEDSNGMMVSVLSGLARLDIDPWQEAAQLAQATREVGTQRLVSLIGALRDTGSAYPDPPTIAARLIALLPKPDQSSNRSNDASNGVDRVKPWWIYVIMMSFVLGTQFFVASQKPPTSPDNVPTSSSTASPQRLPVNTGQ